MRANGGDQSWLPRVDDAGRRHTTAAGRATRTGVRRGPCARRGSGPGIQAGMIQAGMIQAGIIRAGINQAGDQTVGDQRDRDQRDRDQRDRGQRNGRRIGRRTGRRAGLTRLACGALRRFPRGPRSCRHPASSANTRCGLTKRRAQPSGRGRFPGTQGAADAWRVARADGGGRGRPTRSVRGGGEIGVLVEKTLQILD